MYLCQFGQNLAIGSEDRVQTKLFESWKLGQGHENLIILFGCPNEVSVQVWSKSFQRFIS